jgi:hypothetical protein
VSKSSRPRADGDELVLACAWHPATTSTESDATKSQPLILWDTILKREARFSIVICETADVISRGRRKQVIR